MAESRKKIQQKIRSLKKQLQSRQKKNRKSASRSRSRSTAVVTRSRSRSRISRRPSTLYRYTTTGKSLPTSWKTTTTTTTRRKKSNSRQRPSVTRRRVITRSTPKGRVVWTRSNLSKRKSPATSATDPRFYEGYTKLGMDGNLWSIRESSNGVRRWVRA